MIHLYLRATEDWSKVTYKNIDYWMFVGHKHLIHMFDEKFALTWIEYRRIIKDIAMDNWRHLDVNVIDIGKRNNLSFVNDLEDDDWVLPIDDDDWYHPSMPTILREAGKDANYVCWDSWMVKTALNFEKIHIFNRGSYCKYVSTNAYGIRARFLKSLPYDRKRKLLMNHSKSLISALDFGCKDVLDWRDKKMPLSVYNLHPGSISFLKFNSLDDLSRAIPSNKPVKLSSNLQWMRSYYDRIVEAVQSLIKTQVRIYL